MRRVPMSGAERWSACCLGLTVLFAAACGGGSGNTASGGSGAWVGTVTTEGDVTTVINESGSVWDGAATLTEEMSIGVESGDEAYMFGRVGGVYATDDEIFVVDSQRPAIRVYDHAGRHLRDIGAQGQGPGEFQNPQWVSVTPDGRVFTLAVRNNRVNIYGPEPGAFEDWPLRRLLCCLHPMAVTDEGVVWVESGIVNEQRRNYDPAILEHGPDGPADEPFRVPDFGYERWTLRYNGRDIEAVPFAPEIVFAISPAGRLVAGSSDRYRFEIISPSGPKTVVERYWDPVEPTSMEIEYNTRLVRERYTRTESGTEASLEWDGRIPGHKPAFAALMPTHDGGVWVIREGPAEIIEGCDPSGSVPSPLGRGPDRPARCFTTPSTIDAFDGEGRYLGEVRTEHGEYFFPSHTFVGDDTLITQTQDTNGTIMIKRYRIAKPGEAG